MQVAQFAYIFFFRLWYILTLSHCINIFLKFALSPRLPEMISNVHCYTRMILYKIVFMIGLFNTLQKKIRIPRENNNKTVKPFKQKSILKKNISKYSCAFSWPMGSIDQSPLLETQRR